MDVDNGTSLSFCFISKTCSFSLETSVSTKERTRSVRFLPYVLVPGMSINSRPFLKAQATVAKQITTPGSSPAPKAHVQRLFNLQQGKFLIYLTKFSVNHRLLDIDPSLIGDLDRQIIQKARDVVSNATMVEIMNEEPHGPSAFRDAVRQQVLALCTRLRISLVIIDQLMALFNSLSAKINK